MSPLQQEWPKDGEKQGSIFRENKGRGYDLLELCE